MKLVRTSTALIVILIFTTSATRAQSHISPTVPLENELYPFLHRLAALEVVPLELVTTSPINRMEAAFALQAAVSRYGDLNSAALRQDLDYFIREFSVELKQLAPATPAESRRARPTAYNPAPALESPHWHLVRHHEPDWSFTLDPITYARTDFNQRKSIFRRGTGIQFYGLLYSRMGYYFRFVDHVEQGGGAYFSRTQLLEDNAGYVGPLRGEEATSWDVTDVSLSARWGPVNWSFAKEALRWGAVEADPLALSGRGPSFLSMRFDVPLGKKADFHYILGQLNAMGAPGDTVYQTPLGWERVLPAEKWVAMHRVEYSPVQWCRLAVGEAVVWGETGIEASYLLPLNFFFSAEHDGADRDNVLLFGDVTVRPMPGMLSWAGVIIDDLSLSKLGTDDPGNKFGVQAGAVLYSLLVDGLDIRTTYTRLEPYLFTHFFPVNRYTNWSSNIGNSLPPNSDRFSIELDFRLGRKLTFRTELQSHRHGSIGGDVTIPVAKGGTLGSGFLGGERTSWLTRSAAVEWQPLPALTLTSGRIVADYNSNVPDRYFLSVAYRLER